MVARFTCITDLHQHFSATSDQTTSIQQGKQILSCEIHYLVSVVKYYVNSPLQSGLPAWNEGGMYHLDRLMKGDYLKYCLRHREHFPSVSVWQLCNGDFFVLKFHSDKRRRGETLSTFRASAQLIGTVRRRMGETACWPRKFPALAAGERQLRAFAGVCPTAQGQTVANLKLALRMCPPPPPPVHLFSISCSFRGTWQ